MKWRRARLLFDLMLSGMLIFEMFYTLTGNLLHEVVGLAFFATLVIHVALSRRWLAAMTAKTTSTRKPTMKQRVKLGVCITLMIAFLFLLISSLLISNTLSSITGWMLDGQAYGFWSFIHTLSAYGFCGLTLCHVALHWVGVLRTLRIPYDPSRRRALNMGVMSVAAIGIGALSVSAAKVLGGFPIEAVPAEEANSDPNNASPNRNDAEYAESANRKHQNGARNGSRNGSDLDIQDSDGSAQRNQNRSNADVGTSSSDGVPANPSASICTLCGKRCRLSAPRCDRPYRAGLL